MILTHGDYKKNFSPTTIYDVTDDPILAELFKINNNTNQLIFFVDAAHVNHFCKFQYTTGLIFTFMIVFIIYKLNTQSITAAISTEAYLISVHTAFIKIAVIQTNYTHSNLY